MSFGENLSRLRRARGLNQEDLASQVQVSRQAISKWENDDAMPDLPKLLAVADALEISLDELCGRETYAAAPAAAAEPAAAPPAAPPQQRHALRLVLRFVLALALGFVLAMVLGMDGPPQGDAVPPLDESFSISGLGFSCDDKGYLSYHFTPSISGEGLSYRIIFTDSQGISSGYDVPCSDGVCSGTAGGLLGHYGYSVSISVSNGQSTRSVAVANNLNFGNYHVSWTPLD